MIKYMEDVNILTAEMTEVIEQMLEANNCVVTEEENAKIFNTIKELIEPFCETGNYRFQNG